MIFQVIAYLLFLSFIYFVLKINFLQSLFFIAFFIGLLIFTAGYYWRLKDGVLTKYIFFLQSEVIMVKDIKVIEAVARRKLGEVYFKIGKGLDENEYYFVLKEHKVSSFAGCKNSKGETIGRYLNKVHRIKLIETTQYRLFN
ncbi:hypothetical protein FU659_18420 [Paenibacillus sp. N3.4]|nr:hypothetical protein FU659_18420 [Paenibacillus sp. N3.4]